MKTEDNIKTAVILAAGQGSRMNVKNEVGFSKPMILVLGKPLISFIIDALIAIGIKEIIIVKRIDDFKIFKISDYYKNTNFIFISDNKCNGSLNSFLTVKNAVHYPFLLTDCDIICNKYLFCKMIKEALDNTQLNKNLFGFVAAIDNTFKSSEKILKVDGKRAIAFNKKGIKNGVCGGMVYLFFKSPFKIAKSVITRNITSYAIFFNELLTGGKMYTMHITDMWDVDTIEEVKITEELLRREY